MHGGFENETPNIPTNSILKLDLLAHVKGNAVLTQKLESAFTNQANTAKADANKNTKDGSQIGNSRAATPPMYNLIDKKNAITIGKGEIEKKKG